MIASILSLLIPGLGQFVRGARSRGVTVLLLVGTALLFAVWHAEPGWFAAVALLWLWNVWDATRITEGHSGAPVGIALALWLGIALGIGVQVTEADFGALWRNSERAAVMLRPMLRPDLFEPGTLTLSYNGGFLVQGLLETLGMAVMATTLGALFALPVSLFAARNLMSANVITRGLYFVVRTALNITRSIESLIMAIVFVVIVGLGPFAGLLAIVIHTTAALAKLFSEVIEAIDPGPIEAIRGTGANWVQVVRYAVVPQIVPQFTALTIYRWDINVRTSTIIGFVGGGGVGLYLYQWIRNGDYRAVSSAFIGIAVVVIAMDIFSARVRARLG